MKKVFACAVTVGLLCAANLTAQEMKKADHGIFKPADIQWQDGPPSLPKGVKLAVLEGNPAEEGLFTIRLSAPDGYRIPPHWHAAFEHVTVISGSFLLGMGEKFDETKLQVVPTGGFSFMAPGMRHFAVTRGETVVQVHAMGPWQLYYVNPADDPRKAAPPK